MSTADVIFTGPIPKVYDTYLGPLLFEPYAEDLAERLRDLRSGWVLEIAAGTGIATRALTRVLPSTVEIVASDLNQAMLDLAATRLGAPNVRWQQADAQELPFEESDFDVVVCQFGVMLFPDKEASFREVLHVLVPGGRYLFNIWSGLEDNEVCQTVSQAVADLFPDNPPRFLERIPYGYGDTDQIIRDVELAGFKRVEIETVEKVSRAPSAREAAIGLCQGTPLRAEIEARAPDRLDEATAKAEEALRERFGSSAIEGRMKAYVVSAWSPKD
jgi:ubiquinone/menaquinone biosynthesis C-methylase UbiE